MTCPFSTFKATTDLREAGLWTRIVDTFTPLHYGTFGGLSVKILWCLGGLAPGVLAVSGFTIWWLRRRNHTTRAQLAKTNSIPSLLTR